MYQVDSGAYWQAQLMHWGPKILIAILILVVTWIVARAVGWVLRTRRSTAARPQEARDGHARETVATSSAPSPSSSSGWSASWPRSNFLGFALDPRPDQRAGHRIFVFLPKLIGAGADLLRRAGPVADRQAARRDRRSPPPTSTAFSPASGSAPRKGRVRTDPAGGSSRSSAGRDAHEHRPSRRRPRLCADHHPLCDRGTSGPRDRSDFGAGDGNAQPRSSPPHPASSRRGAVDRYRLHCRAIPQDHHRGDPSADRLRRRDPFHRSPSGDRLPVADRREHRDDRDHPRRFRSRPRRQLGGDEHRDLPRASDGARRQGDLRDPDYRGRHFPRADHRKSGGQRHRRRRLSRRPSSAMRSSPCSRRSA